MIILLWMWYYTLQCLNRQPRKHCYAVSSNQLPYTDLQFSISDSRRTTSSFPSIFAVDQTRHTMIGGNGMLCSLSLCTTNPHPQQCCKSATAQCILPEYVLPCPHSAWGVWQKMQEVHSRLVHLYAFHSRFSKMNVSKWSGWIRSTTVIFLLLILSINISTSALQGNN